MGKIIKPTMVSSIRLESGAMLFWCDKTINRILKRVK